MNSSRDNDLDERRRPERPRQVIANPDEVGTGSKSSAIVRGVKGHDPVVMVCMAGHAVQLYVSIAVNRRVLVRCSGPPRCEYKLFTHHLNLHTALSPADTISMASWVMMPVQWLARRVKKPHSTARRVTYREPGRATVGPSDKAIWRPCRHNGEAWARPQGQMVVRSQRPDYLIAGHDPGAIGCTLGRVSVLEVLASAALLSACSGHCYVTGASPAGNSEA